MCATNSELGSNDGHGYGDGSEPVCARPKLVVHRQNDVAFSRVCGIHSTESIQTQRCVLSALQNVSYSATNVLSRAVVWTTLSGVLFNQKKYYFPIKDRPLETWFDKQPTSCAVIDEKIVVYTL